MRNLLNHATLAGVVGWVLLPAALAQTPATPDLSGVWLRAPNSPEYFSTTDPPLLPAAKRIYDENRGGQVEGLDKLDPTTYCMPYGFPRAYGTAYPFEIVQTPKVVYMLLEPMQMQRRIYLDVRKMPDGYPPSFMGFSTGKYEGDTLVVETVGFNDLTWIDHRGIPHTEELRVTERIRRASPTELEMNIQFNDPKSFSRPWGDTKTFLLRPDWQILEHIGFCEDRFRYNHKQKMFMGAVGWPLPPEQAKDAETAPNGKEGGAVK